MTVTHPLAVAWLDRVERLAADLPAGERAELLADLRDHLDAALAGEPDDATVAAVVNRLGDPADVVAAARSDTPAPATSMPPPAADAPAGLTGGEVVALATLILAGLVGLFVWPLSLLLWAVGIAAMAVAGRWRGGEVLGMILLPVVWAVPVVSVVAPVGMSSTTCQMDASGAESCVTQQSGLGGPLVLVGVLVLLVLIVLGTRWLARAPRGRARR